MLSSRQIEFDGPVPPRKRPLDAQELRARPTLAIVARYFDFLDRASRFATRQRIAGNGRSPCLQSRADRWRTDRRVHRNAIDRLSSRYLALVLGLNQLIGLGHVVIGRRPVAHRDL